MKRHHGANVQVLTDPSGQLLWASPALPGATHDPAARGHGIIDAPTDADLKCLAGKAYQGAARNVRVTFKGRRLKRWQRRYYNTHAKIRYVSEQAMATLKNWRLLRNRVYFRSIGQMRVVANLRHCRARHRLRALRRLC